MPGILNGLKIVEASAFVAAPYAGMVLAEMGADVIRIDPVAGGLDAERWPLAPSGRSLYWAGLNKGKKSILLDVRSEQGREIAHRLMTRSGEDAGIVLTNLPARGWLDYEKLRARRDDLIMVNLLGNRDGSIALDYTINAAAGFPLNQGPTDHAGPVNSLLPAWDLLAGMAASNAILAADRRRRIDGVGQFVKLALADAAFHAMGALGYIGEVEINDAKRPKTGNHVYGTFCHDFETSDGRRLVVTAFTPRHWQNLVRALSVDVQMRGIENRTSLNLSNEADRWAVRDEIVAVLSARISELDLNAVRKLFDDNDVCWGPYQTFYEAVKEDPRVSEQNPMFKKVSHPEIGEYLTSGSVLDFSNEELVEPGVAPLHGQHTEEVLYSELDMTQREVGELVDSGVVSLGYGVKNRTKSANAA